MIRAATANDAPSLANLDAQCNPSAWTAKQFQAACEHDTVLLAENEHGAICGFIVWQTVCDEMELHLIATAPEHRRCGVASDLLAQMFQAACKQQIKRILLEVRASNVAAQQLYARHGFVVLARRKNYYGGTEDALIMEKIC